MKRTNTMPHKWDNGHQMKISSIDGLVVFEGNKRMFENCFFSDAGWDQVISWTEQHHLIIRLKG